MKIFIVPIEPIDTRYTRQWYDTLPRLLQSTCLDACVLQIDGDEVSPDTTKGAFLNFAATNIYKSSQLIKIAKMFQNGNITPGDKFVFTDFWNTSILQVKYMSDLLGIPVEIHGLAHAGAYDKHDFLGQLIKDPRWANHTEKALYHSLDYIYFATEQHRQLFKDNVFGPMDKDAEYEFNKKAVQTGWPMHYMEHTLSKYKSEKEDIIIFPHRIASEKQPEIFYDLQKELPQYKFVVCQEKCLTKDEYHSIMSKAKVLFSANLQETLGITTCGEGPILDVIPFAPNRLSYTEIFSQHSEFLYPSEWTESWDSYLVHKESIKASLINFMESYDEMVPLVRDYVGSVYQKYFIASNLIKQLSK